MWSKIKQLRLVCHKWYAMSQLMGQLQLGDSRRQIHMSTSMPTLYEFCQNLITVQKFLITPDFRAFLHKTIF